MFNQTISSPISPLTRNYIGKLVRPEYEPDYSLVCLATALIKPRVESYSGIEGTYWYCNNANHVMTKMQSFNQQRENLRKDAADNMPGFYYLYTDFNEEDLKAIKEYAKELKLVELTTVESFVFQQLNVSNYGVFISPENNAAFMTVGTSSMALYHLSISFIPLLYPALFKKHPLNKQEAEVLKALTNKTHAAFTEKASELLQYMKTDILRQELSECFKGFRQTRIDNCKQLIDDADNQIEQLMVRYRNLMAQRDDYIVRYEGLMALNGPDRNKEEEETVEYLCECPNVHNVTYSNNTLKFCAESLFTNFDLQKWQSAIRRNNIYDGYRIPDDSPFRSQTNRKMLFDSIFNSRPKLYVRMKANFELKLTACDMTVPRGQTEAEVNINLKDCITNPHFKIHGCPGQNKHQIIACLRQGDVVSAVECSIAAVGSININETEYTFRPFLQELLTSKNKVLQNDKGEKMTPEEALLWLSKQEKERPATYESFATSNDMMPF